MFVWSVRTWSDSVHSIVDSPYKFRSPDKVTIRRKFQGSYKCSLIMNIVTSHHEGSYKEIRNDTSEFSSQIVPIRASGFGEKIVVMSCLFYDWCIERTGHVQRTVPVCTSEMSSCPMSLLLVCGMKQLYVLANLPKSVGMLEMWLVRFVFSMYTHM